MFPSDRSSTHQVEVGRHQQGGWAPPEVPVADRGEGDQDRQQARAVRRDAPIGIHQAPHLNMRKPPEKGKAESIHDPRHLEGLLLRTRNQGHIH